MFTERRYYLILLFIYTLFFALIAPDRDSFITKINLLLGEQTYLIHDFFKIAGLSVTFFNVAMHILIVYLLLIFYSNSKVDGKEFAALGTFIGHSFFGTNFLNILPSIVGGILYLNLSRGKKVFSHSAILFVTGTAPLVTYLALGNGSSIDNYIFSCILGFLIGFITLPLGEHFYSFHKGFSLYNFGFTTGIISMMALLLLEYLDFSTPPKKIVISDFSIFPILYFIGILVLILIYLITHKSVDSLKIFRKLIKSSGNDPHDFVTNFGLQATFLNLFLNGCLYFIILVLFGQQLSGPTLGGLINLLGFSAFGKNFLNCYPITIGIILGAILTRVSLSDIQCQMALVFGCGLAPITSTYGKAYGIIAGLLHFNMVIVTFWLHKGLSLYNTKVL